MPKYMILIGGPEHSRAGDPSYAPVMAKYQEWTQKIIADGQMVMAHKLFDHQGRRLSIDAGKVIDGPHVETKETVGGFYIIEARTLAEATAVASECPTLTMQGGFVDVRPVEF